MPEIWQLSHKKWSFSLQVTTTTTNHQVLLGSNYLHLISFCCPFEERRGRKRKKRETFSQIHLNGNQSKCRAAHHVVSGQDDDDNDDSLVSLSLEREREGKRQTKNRKKRRVNTVKPN